LNFKLSNEIQNLKEELSLTRKEINHKSSKSIIFDKICVQRDM